MIGLLEALIAENTAQTLSPKILKSRLRKIETQWKQIGPTYNEKWLEIKEKYYQLINPLYDLLKSNSIGVDEQTKAKIETKKEIIELLSRLIQNYPHQKNKWIELTQTFLKVEAHWKNIGFLYSPEDKDLNQQFKQLYLDFFKQKKAFYKVIINDYKVHRITKRELLDQMKTLVEETNLQNWSKKLEKVQQFRKQFAQIPSAGQKFDRLFWDELNAYCDDFYNKKRADQKAASALEQENLIKKKEILAALEQYELTDYPEQDINQLEDWVKNFGALQTKDQVVNIKFKNILDKKCNALSIAEEEKDRIRFNLIITASKGNQDPELALSKEKDFYTREYNKVNEEISKLENNLGFFGKNARAMGGLFEGVEAELSALKQRQDFLKEQIHLLEKTKKDIAG